MMNDHRKGVFWRISGCMPMLLLLAGCQTTDAARQVEVNHAYVASEAAKLAASPFKPVEGALPQELVDLNYDAYRQIRFRPEEALWKPENLPFRAEFFHPGYLFKQPVQMQEFTATHEQQIRFRKQYFSYENLDLDDRLPASLGYAGVRILHPLNDAGLFDEVIVFQGGTYFRALGREQVWGLSARSLAVDTAVRTGEEFPFFRKLWLGKPEPGDTHLVIHGLVDGPSVTGAFSFHIEPGRVTRVRVTATVYLRKEVELLGIAPMSSMFWFGEGSRRCFDDFRPEVHDSDGLLIAGEDGEWLWRPLDNPTHLRQTFFKVQALKGFGLLQRDRAFSSYQDLEAKYERRPSLWVEPVGSWGPGKVALIEIPTADEYMDNMVALWRPAELPAPGQPLRISYVLNWQLSSPMPQGLGQALSVRAGASPRHAAATELVIDFDGLRLDELLIDSPLEAVVSCAQGGRILHQDLVRNEEAGTWRLNLTIAPSGGDIHDFDVRAHLRLPSGPLTETVTYRWNR